MPGTMAWAAEWIGLVSSVKLQNASTSSWVKTWVCLNTLLEVLGLSSGAPVIPRAAQSGATVRPSPATLSSRFPNDNALARERVFLWLCYALHWIIYVCCYSYTHLQMRIVQKCAELFSCTIVDEIVRHSIHGRLGGRDGSGRLGVRDDPHIHARRRVSRV
jgi:hypothetical protein